uniref:Uncharacterized protein n=1 Tax=Populus trichocarpa TaxID=3694 RepID=A0A3N7GCY9_POPTR
MFISKAKDPIVAGTEDKIATWTSLPKEGVNVDRGEHRLATVLVYLTDVEKGGETVSPSAEVRSRCPVIEGEKWSATKWIHVDSFDKNVEAGGNCTDQNESCERWAALGERTKNTEYTVGSPDLPGYCRSSKVC